MKKVFLLLLGLGFPICLYAGGITPGAPQKIIGPSGASVDASTGNIGITAGSGGAVNVTNGDVYVPTIIDYSTAVSPSVSASGHYKGYFDGTNFKYSVNGGAYVTLGSGGTIPSTTNLLVGDGAGNASAAGNGTMSGNLTVSGGSITGGSTGLSLAAGGSNQNITLTPSGTGSVTIGGSVGQLFIGASGGIFYNNSGTSTVYRGSSLQIQGPGASAAGLIQFFGGTTNDTGLARNAAGVVEINNGTAGTYRDLLVRYGTIGGSSGTQIKLIKSATATLDFPSTAAQSSSELTITVTGAAVGDECLPPGLPASPNANTSFSAYVSATDTVTIRFNNYSSGAVDPASGTYRAGVIQF